MLSFINLTNIIIDDKMDKKIIGMVPFLIFSLSVVLLFSLSVYFELMGLAGFLSIAVLGVMMFVFTFVVATIFVEPLKELIDINRDSEHLDCGADNLTTGTAATCVIVDITLPFFIAIVIGSGAGLITSRRKGA